MAKRLIGSATTNANGVASVTYTGAGRGLLNVFAESGSLQSEIFEVLDCIVKDNGTSDNYNNNLWQVETGLSLNRLTEYSQLIEVSTTSANCYCTIPSECVVELDLKQVDGANNNYWLNLKTTSNQYKSGTNLNNVGANINEWVHLKLQFQNGVCTYTNTDNERSTTFNTNITDTNIRFAINTGGATTEYHFKNFKVYPI